MDQIGSGRTFNRDIALTGLIAGLGLGALNAIVYLFFVFPIVANHFFHTYLHYGANVLGYTAGYIGVLGIMGILTALLVARSLTKKSVDGTNVGALQRQSPEEAIAADRR